MILVRLVILQTTWSKGHVILWVGSLIVSHHHAKFGEKNHYFSGDMFSVAEEEDSRCSNFNCQYCLSLKDMTWKHTARNINNCDPGHKHLKQQLEKNLKITLVSPSKKAVEKNEEKLIMAIAKLFALHANAKICVLSTAAYFKASTLVGSQRQ